MDNLSLEEMRQEYARLRSMCPCSAETFNRLAEQEVAGDLSTDVEGIKFLRAAMKIVGGLVQIPVVPEVVLEDVPIACTKDPTQDVHNNMPIVFVNVSLEPGGREGPEAKKLQDKLRYQLQRHGLILERGLILVTDQEEFDSNLVLVREEIARHNKSSSSTLGISLYHLKGEAAEIAHYAFREVVRLLQRIAKEEEILPLQKKVRDLKKLLSVFKAGTAAHRRLEELTRLGKRVNKEGGLPVFRELSKGALLWFEQQPVGE